MTDPKDPTPLDLAHFDGRHLFSCDSRNKLGFGASQKPCDCGLPALLAEVRTLRSRLSEARGALEVAYDSMRTALANKIEAAVAALEAKRDRWVGLGTTAIDAMAALDGEIEGLRRAGLMVQMSDNPSEAHTLATEKARADAAEATAREATAACAAMRGCLERARCQHVECNPVETHNGCNARAILTSTTIGKDWKSPEEHARVVGERDAEIAALREALRDPATLEALAAIEHERWSSWERYREDALRRTTHASGEHFDHRWRRLRGTAYADLSESEKESDRVEARKSLVAIEEAQAARLKTKSGEGER